eukprot:gnl/TRDRNA2_/TRDRNA2_158882_c0_seq1.p1 gnl/TRDRNA2_/TRDRNA2_158882_c0~~gnl/TRDRNA2_/TRDRNA2_158882_c0_seq1.p1  ORF type:complete len:255 (-),score=28.60 gnl/TRDRNA2_/TRDRNA2_158882_c0_seq1:54-713(-)
MAWKEWLASKQARRRPSEKPQDEVAVECAAPLCPHREALIRRLFGQCLGFRLLLMILEVFTEWAGVSSKAPSIERRRRHLGVAVSEVRTEALVVRALKDRRRRIERITLSVWHVQCTRSICRGALRGISERLVQERLRDACGFERFALVACWGRGTRIVVHHLLRAWQSFSVTWRPNPGGCEATLTTRSLSTRRSIQLAADARIAAAGFTTSTAAAAKE